MNTILPFCEWHAQSTSSPMPFQSACRPAMTFWSAGSAQWPAGVGVPNSAKFPQSYGKSIYQLYPMKNVCKCTAYPGKMSGYPKSFYAPGQPMGALILVKATVEALWWSNLKTADIIWRVWYLGVLGVETEIDLESIPEFQNLSHGLKEIRIIIVKINGDF